MRRVLALALVMSIAAGALAAESVSIISLVTNPEKYDGKAVIITGFLALDFEGSAIYLHKEDYEYSIYKNGLWCSISEVKYKSFDHRYVCMEGVFDAKGKGHLGLWSGEIKDVQRVWQPVRPGKAKN